MRASSSAASPDAGSIRGRVAEGAICSSTHSTKTLAAASADGQITVRVPPSASVIRAAACNSRPAAMLRSRSKTTVPPALLTLLRAKRIGPGANSYAASQPESTRRCPATGRASAPATTRSRSVAAESAVSALPRTISNEYSSAWICGRSEKVLAGADGGGAQLKFELLGGQRPGACAGDDFLGDLQTSQAQQILVFDKNGVQRRTTPPASRTAISIAVRISAVASRTTTTLSIGLLNGGPPDQRRCERARRLERQRRRAERLCGGSMCPPDTPR